MLTFLTIGLSLGVYLFLFRLLFSDLFEFWQCICYLNRDETHYWFKVYTPEEREEEFRQEAVAFVKFVAFFGGCALWTWGAFSYQSVLH